MKMWRVIYILVVCAGSFADAQECSIDGGDVSVSLTIDDTHVNEVMFTGLATGITGVSLLSLYVSDSAVEKTMAMSYFNYSLDGNFTLSTTKEFSNVDQDSYTAGQNLAISLAFIFECQVIRDPPLSLAFFVTVLDTNNHPPEFSANIFEFNVPMPIMPKMDFSLYGSTVVEATDIDFSNTLISFMVEPDDFEVGGFQTGNKSFTATFSARSLMWLSQPKTYTIVATDAGKIPGPLSTNATLIITVDQSAGLDIPSFSRATYAFTYSETTGSLSSDESIVAVTNKVDKIDNVGLNGLYASYFQADRQGETFTIRINSRLPINTEYPIILTLNFQTDVLASTTLIIALEAVELDSPTFSKDFYRFNYVREAFQIQAIDGPVILFTSKPDGVSNLTLTGEYAQYFICTLVENDQQTIKVVPSDVVLPETSGSVIPLELSLTTDALAKTTLIVTIEEKASSQLYFATVFYTFEYKIVDGQPILNSTDGNISIYASNPEDEVNVTFDDGLEYVEYFSVIKQGSGFHLQLLRPLPSDALETKSSIALKLVAQNSEGNIAYATAIINLPASDVATDNSAFNANIYMAAVIVLCILLLAVVMVALYLWCLKRRLSLYVKLMESSMVKDVLLGTPKQNIRPSGTMIDAVPGDQTTNSGVTYRSEYRMPIRDNRAVEILSVDLKRLNADR
ncbi:uncharacterized protein LOC132697061 isoform X1 [Cylas formicarius]|uniref:uncharacterized protein LOC132697061 isoform X1 n=1 Tax=Cylas formicarius TaxID=197179 RepID=UPI002958A644|nr:uncharacterized protein LOC132697061 isoform X1 [Cylas formicarius]